MNGRTVTKFVVNQLTSIGTSSLVAGHIRATRPHFTNPILDAIVDVSSFVSTFAVAGVIQDKHVKPYVDEQVDSIFDAFAALNPNA